MRGRTARHLQQPLHTDLHVCTEADCVRACNQQTVTCLKLGLNIRAATVAGLQLPCDIAWQLQPPQVYSVSCYVSADNMVDVSQ